MYDELGNLGKIIKLIDKIIKKEYIDFTGKKEELNFIIKKIYEQVCEQIPNTKYGLISDIINRFFDCKYKIKPLSFDNGTNGFRNWDNKYEIDEIKTKCVKVPKEYIELEKHFQKLYSTPQPEQRTDEWFQYRYNRITASDMATAIDMNPYESIENFIYKKCDPNYPFLDNKFVFHGKKYEQIATLLYEHVYNNKVTEFGCLPSDKYKILGASPDGICSKSTLNNVFSSRLGTMLEIKCPYSREIKTSGIIVGDICPFYYYCQVQQQLACCDLKQCDFWQCKIIQYESRKEYLLDVNFNAILTEGIKGKRKSLDNMYARGCLIQLLPKKYEPTHDEDEHQFKSSYLYPPRLDMDMKTYDEWCLETISNWQTLNPELAENYYFDKIIYWKIPQSHNVTIKRNDKWFNSIYPILEDTWKQVLYYRKHPEEIPKLQMIADKRRKFYRLNTNFKINNFEPGIHFLRKEVKMSAAKKSKTKVPKYLKEEVDCDFID